uniref:Uncharacterized protein n=1 Tax=Manihot esculenta TaxID=3983 RepID=A0A2C9UVB4_MANES
MCVVCDPIASQVVNSQSQLQMQTLKAFLYSENIQEPFKSKKQLAF